jgi:polyphosphate glucokinase
VQEVTARLRAALQAEYVVLGGGNAKKLNEVPQGVELGDNANAFLGGFRMWEKRYAHQTVARRRRCAAPVDELC